MVKKRDCKVVFITTSPRTPSKMIPEIELLNTHFGGQVWNVDTQIAFMELLKEESFFNGRGAKDPALSARDRMTRAPKSLGFVILSPTISLTPAGQELVQSKRKEEIFLRQLLKFQLPSPFHKFSDEAAKFWVKPYLELFRLIRHFGSLKFDEVKIFGLQLVDYRMFDAIVAKIEQFRVENVQNEGKYKAFYRGYMRRELMQIYQDEIATGKIKIRESKICSVDNFLRAKESNMRDYTDACFRYLRATGLVNISSSRKSISIAAEKVKDVDYFLKNIDRKPCFVDNENDYVAYLGNAQLPQLLTDNRELLLDKFHSEFSNIHVDESASLPVLKELLDKEMADRKECILAKQVSEMKDYKQYDEIQTMFSQITKKSLYDSPLMLEWNTWRAMTMLDGGEIKANLKFDDFGNPMSTAQGNMADIICDYGDFGLAVEVTMQSGQRQYEMEGEPVTRHLAKLKKEMNKPAYCLFVAPAINEACIAHFYALHKMNISYYGGKSTIVPLPLNLFQKMLEDSYKASYIPDSKTIKRFFERSKNLAETCDNEKVWYEKITAEALHWLALI
jgi:hypothetical protein